MDGLSLPLWNSLGNPSIPLPVVFSSRDPDRGVHAHAGIPSAAVPGIRGCGRSRLESGIAHGGLSDRGELLVEFHSFPRSFGNCPGILEFYRVWRGRIQTPPGHGTSRGSLGVDPEGSRCPPGVDRELPGAPQVWIRRIWNSPGVDPERTKVPVPVNPLGIVTAPSSGEHTGISGDSLDLSVP